MSDAVELVGHATGYWVRRLSDAVELDDHATGYWVTCEARARETQTSRRETRG
jgi:hypothetical protein